MCDPGQYMVDSECTDCVGDVDATYTKCTACTGLNYFDATAKKCSICAGTVSTDKKTCTPCAEYKYFSTVDAACMACSGAVSSDKLSCEACGTNNTWSDSSTTPVKCKNCVGTVNADFTTCTACGADQYYDGATKTCKVCIGTISTDKKTCTLCSDNLPFNFYGDPYCQYLGRCKYPEYFNSTEKKCKECKGNVSADKLTCTDCLAGSSFITTSLGGSCRTCPGFPTTDWAKCYLCSRWNTKFDQATKKCVGCPVPGIVTASGWTETSLPVETCTPCDATKNEIADDSNLSKPFTCQTCKGTIGLSTTAGQAGVKDFTCTPCATGYFYNSATTTCACSGTLSADKLTCTACAAGTIFTPVDGKCIECIGTRSDDLLTCTKCRGLEAAYNQHPATWDSSSKSCKDCNGTPSDDRLTCVPCPSNLKM